MAHAAGIVAVALAAGVAVLTAGYAAGCAPAPPDHAVLAKAYDNFDAMRYEAAVTGVKSYLLHHPRDAGAHWLLGACYRNMTPPWLTLAEGEFGVALALLEQTGRPGGLDRFADTQSLTFEIHRGRALAGMQWILAAMDRGMKPHHIRRLARQTLDHVQEALAMRPDHEELEEMRVTLRGLLDETETEEPAAAEPFVV
ncbi:MAG: hypothetical protein ACLFTT_07630 [Candidatus Hydrogenedentota bacterium]